MISQIKNVRGMRDLFGEDYKKLKLIRDIAYELSELYLFSPIDTPIIEYIDVFKRSLDATSDIISKEIYAFTDKSGADVALRPEFTASVARSFVQNFQHYPIPLKLFSVGPLFRYERPQKGRFRQFNQFNFEVIGVDDHNYDVELIEIALLILMQLKISTKVTLEINSLGDDESKEIYKIKLRDYLLQHQDKLSEDSRRRLHTNTLRILDSKDPVDQAVLSDAPRIDEYYNDFSLNFFNNFKNSLHSKGIEYIVNTKLVRGLDYYSHTVFEFKIEEDRSQNTIVGGGRYENLISIMGGKKLACAGFAAGMERLMDISTFEVNKKQLISLVPIGEKAEFISLSMIKSLRKNGFCTDYLYNATLKKRMSRASQSDFAVIFGDNEIDADSVNVKNMRTGNEILIKNDLIIEFLRANESS